MAPFNGQPTHSQQVALALAPKFTASLSIVCSSYIVFDCYRAGRKKTGNRPSFDPTYRRLMTGLSITDIIMSIGLFTSTWFMPKDTPYVWGAMGNTATCEFIGFLETANVATLLYNVSLSIYYLWRIRNNWPSYRIVKAEPYLHLVPIVFGLSTMIAGYVLDLYNSGIFDCWIAPYPQGCKESWRNNGETTCIRGDNATLYQWVFDLIPKWSSVILVTIIMVMIHRALARQERQSLKWRTSTALSSFAHRNTHSSAQTLDSSHLSDTSAPKPKSYFWQGLLKVLGRSPPSGPHGHCDASSSLSLRAPWTSTSQANKAQAQKLTASQQLARQSYLYVGALYLIWTPVWITRLTELFAGHIYYQMLLTISITIPLQGFWNMLIYLRPRYLKKRQEQKAKRRSREKIPSSVGKVVNEAGMHFGSILKAFSEAVREGDLREEDGQDPTSEDTVDASTGEFHESETPSKARNISLNDRNHDALQAICEDSETSDDFVLGRKMFSNADESEVIVFESEVEEKSTQFGFGGEPSSEFEPVTEIDSKDHSDFQLGRKFLPSVVESEVIVFDSEVSAQEESTEFTSVNSTSFVDNDSELEPTFSADRISTEPAETNCMAPFGEVNETSPSQEASTNHTDSDETMEEVSVEDHKRDFNGIP